MSLLKNTTDQELLQVLLNRNNIQPAPQTITLAGTARIIDIEVDADHTATLILHTDDIEALSRATKYVKPAETE